MATKDISKDLSLEKLPPQNLEAEMAVLCSMLIEEEAISHAIEILNEDSFYKEAHKIIFNAIVSLYNKSRVADIVTLIDELKKRGALEDVGGINYLTSLTTSVPTAANVRHYAKIVKEKSLLRNLIASGTTIVSEAYEAEEDADDLLDKAERMIFEITSKKIEGGFVSLKEIIKDSIETIDSLYQRKTNITGIPTGFHDFDRLTAGLQPSDLIVVAGRPSMGKSAFATSVAEHVGVTEKLPVAIFSLEMSKEQLVQRMLCSHARVDANKVRTGFLSQSDWPRLTNAAGKLSEAPIYIDDSPALSILELRGKARRLKSQHDVQLIIVDYLQLLQSPTRAENRQQEIADISRSLKSLAKELNVPLVAISQLSRGPERREDRRPQLADLRESGAIEQDADVVTLLFREEFYTPTEENRGVAELTIAKQRNGPTGTINLTFIKEYTRFENLARLSEE
ncbi:MAG: replicative DNA helicase [Omnitrophica WOR_2 bacterium SM23_29]|nr:MAG: replicative DNA helicase [Omnitrophica WOR_2 bacterium SM23_29]